MTRLQRRPLLGFLADPFSKSARAIEIDGDNLRITRRGQIASMSLQLLSSPPSVRKGLLGTALAISAGEQEDVILKGTGYRDAKAFSEELKKAWVRFNLSALENEAARLEKILDGVRALVAPCRYPAACQIAPLLEDARALDASLLSKLQPEAIGAETNERISAVRKFVSDPRTERADGIAEKLAPHITLKPRPADTIYDRVIELKQVDDFSKLLGTFLRKFKSGGYSLEDCETKSERLKLGKRAKAFLDVFAPVFEEYQKRLGGRIDFEDMILRAARYAETGRYVSPFRHILVDEFQDISQSRARLVKALKAQHPDVRIFAVGDDWQSIFRFAGSDIHLMRHFGREFGGSFDGETGVHRTVDLGRTFRSIDQIAFAARTFVLRNPAQIQKQIVPAGTSTDPAISIVPVSKGEDRQKLTEVLGAITAKLKEERKTASVLLLGRYRFLAPDLRELRREFPRLRINFKTIHASKGLEADHVVLLNADSGRTGFPSEIVDDPLLSLVSPEEEAFQNAEERRVMYVAMTRARLTLTILASNSRPSSFVTELKQDPAYGLAAAPGSEPDVHVCGECGGRLLCVKGQDGRFWYRCEHVQHCGNLLPACPTCGTALPRRADGKTAARCGCGASYPICPECEDGWLVERSGPYGRFLGCVRYPSCVGKAQISSAGRKASAAKAKS